MKQTKEHLLGDYASLEKIIGHQKSIQLAGANEFCNQRKNSILFQNLMKFYTLETLF